MTKMNLDQKNQDLMQKISKVEKELEIEKPEIRNVPPIFQVTQNAPKED